MKYGEGIYRIIRAYGGWCVAKIVGHHDNGEPVYHRVSELYCYRGWAQNFARRMCLKDKVENYNV